MDKNFLQAVKDRRSVYTIDDRVGISFERIVEIVETAVKYAPSAFNSQSPRAVLLVGKRHKQLWQIVLDSLRPLVPPDKFGPTEEKVAGFAAGYGTVLYFDDTVVTQDFADSFPTYREHFRSWADQANAMLQFTVWCAFEAEGLGVTVQHYNPLIDDKVRQAFDLPDTWRLIAQMPFGNPTGLPDAKDFMPLEERLKIMR